MGCGHQPATSFPERLGVELCRTSFLTISFAFYVLEIHLNRNVTIEFTAKITKGFLLVVILTFVVRTC